MARGQSSKLVNDLRYTIRESDSSTGELTATYIISTATNKSDPDVNFSERKQSTLNHGSRTRIDVLLGSSREAVSNKTDQLTSTSSTSYLYLRQRLFAIQIYLSTLFLPTGYPHTVTADYTPYQIYDSLQAFASSIAGLLSSRAVLQSLNVGISDSETTNGKGSGTTTATYATLLSIAQSTVSNLTTILFASHAAPYIASEVKFYRYLADIVNDAAFVLDCLSPSIPNAYTLHVPGGSIFAQKLTLTFPLRVMALCLSSALRAICGVAGGSSKAVLSAHFARTGNIGELNAKDGSQETVIGLLGMWVGGLVVSRVEGRVATWCWMLSLLGLHLLWNWCAVKSVRLRVLNGRRAGVVFGTVVDEMQKGTRLAPLAQAVSVEIVGKYESVIFARRSNELAGPMGLNSHRKRIQCLMGVSFSELAQAMGAESRYPTGSLVTPSQSGLGHRLKEVLKVCRPEQYIIWYNYKEARIVIALKTNATSQDQLKAWAHATLLVNLFDVSSGGPNDDETGSNIRRTLIQLNDSWIDICSLLQQAGWDLSQAQLEGLVSKRIDIEDQTGS